MSAQTCAHGVRFIAGGPATGCVVCLDGNPVVSLGHLVFVDGRDGVVWLPTHRVLLMRAASEDCPEMHLDVSTVPGDHPDLGRPHDTTDTWWRIRTDDPHRLAATIALGSCHPRHILSLDEAAR